MKLDFNHYNMISKEKKVKGKFINRELSWIDFNNRVLYCANNTELPLNERFKFLAITCSNLDEFIAVRYASAIHENGPVKKILHEIKSFMNKQAATYTILKSALKKEGIKLTTIKDLDKGEIRQLKNVFKRDIFPLLTPVNIGNVNHTPNFYSGQNCIGVIVKQGNEENLIIIPISSDIDRLYEINHKVIMIEDIIITFLNDLFINKEIVCNGYFRIIKNADVCLTHDTSKFLLDRMITTLEKRDSANSLFLIISDNTPKRLQDIITTIFDIESKNVYNKFDILDYTRFMSPILSLKYSYKEFEPCSFDVVEETHSLFTTLKKKDIMLQHPYDSYDTVVKFIEHAAIDPNVITIKQTLYRVSSEDSPIVKALCLAAKRGKNVTVLIEIKARFDEKRNISLIEKLQKAGVNILLGFDYLKTHCKMCIVVRKEKENIKIYSHVGTGNYNEKTSKQYTDISYFTSKQKVGMDLLHVFNILSGISTPDEKLQRVFYAPVNLRKRLIKNIDREIEFAKKGKKAEIFLKLNSISDIEMINKLYEAADKGVEIYIISRGICSIVPRKNIYIKSIVGRFLEHSRIYYFKNGGGKHEEYYISSADLLTRNLDRRVETLLLINDPECVRKLKRIISALKEDKKNSFKMDEEGKFKKIKGDFDVHQYFIDVAEQRSKLKIHKNKK